MYPANISLTSSIQFVQMVEQGRDKSDNRQTNKYEGVLTTSTKLLEIPDSKIAFCQNLKKNYSFPHYAFLELCNYLCISSYEINNGKGPTELHALKKQ